MTLYKFFLKGYCSGLVEGVDLILRAVCQISGRDNVSYNNQNSYWYFQIKVLFMSDQKVTVKIFVLTRVLFVTAILTSVLRC